MVIEYATKRDRNGNRKYLCIDTTKKQFSLFSRSWYCRESFIEISASDRKKLIENCKANLYTQVDYCN